MIDLDELARSIGAAVVPSEGTCSASTGVAVADVEHDSRLVERGSLFACIRGSSADGHDYAFDAVRRGAVALLVEEAMPSPVPNLVVPSVRAALGPAAAAVHRHPSRRLDLVGVTGTNGKTTTVRLLAAILTSAGRTTDEMGTLTGARTTPEATDVQRRLAGAVDRGRRAVAMEVSSHALDQGRVDGCRFRVAAFTNLGHDHLDYHGTMEAYFAAKARLFTPEMSERGVVWMGSPAGRRLAATASIPLTEVEPGAVEVLEFGPGSSRFVWRDRTVEAPLGGRFNIDNAVLAAETAVALGLTPAVVAGALVTAGPVPGRFEIVDVGQDFTVIVDYAHTPEGLEAVLGAARAIAEQGLTVVFGAGGERDRRKRPLMGASAAAADRIVITTDNPRSEDPGRIANEITAGLDRLPDLVEKDRHLAIRHAIATAGPGDVVVIAGKGHEKTQTIGDQVFDFDDCTIVRDELARRVAPPR